MKYLNNRSTDRIGVIGKELKEAGVTIIETGRDEDSGIYNDVASYSVLGVLGGQTPNIMMRTILETHNQMDVMDLIKFQYSFVFVRCDTYYAVMGYIPLSVVEEMYDDPIGRNSIKSSHCSGDIPKKWIELHPIVGQAVISSLNVSGQEGLNFLVKTLKRCGLV